MLNCFMADIQGFLTIFPAIEFAFFLKAELNQSFPEDQFFISGHHCRTRISTTGSAKESPGGFYLVEVENTLIEPPGRVK